MSFAPPGPARGASRRLRGGVWVWRHGWVWPLCIMVAGVAALAEWLLVLPARDGLAQARQALFEAHAAVSTSGAKPAETSGSEASRLARLEDVLRGAGSADGEVSAILDAATRHSIELPRAEYQSTLEAGSEVSRVQIALPIKAPYPALRALVEDVLRSLPNASVDQLDFKRDAVSQSQVEATLKISLWSLPGQGFPHLAIADHSPPVRKP